MSPGVALLPPRVSLCVLAGGESSRMGADKAPMLVSGVPLISRVASALAPIGPITIVGGDISLLDELRTGLGHTYVPDLYPGEGPLGGVLTSLEAGVSTYTLVAACDLANLDTDTVRVLLNEALQTDADVCVPLVRGERQWHIAVWNRRVLPTLQEAFERDVRSIWRAARPLRQTLLTTSESSKYVDLDTPEDISSFVSDSN